jgi:hypothetical protein
VYFAAAPFHESHGLFGLLAIVGPGFPEGPAEAQWVQANVDVVQLDLRRLAQDSASGAPTATIRQDKRILDADSHELARVERPFVKDTEADTGPKSTAVRRHPSSIVYLSRLDQGASRMSRRLDSSPATGCAWTGRADSRCLIDALWFEDERQGTQNPEAKKLKTIEWWRQRLEPVLSRDHAFANDLPTLQAVQP